MRYLLILLLGLFISCHNFDRPDYENITKVVDISKELLELQDVNIKLRPVRKALRLSAQGYGVVLKAHVDQIDSLNYIISVSDLADWEMIEVIAHEMQHVKQFRTGQLVRDGNFITFRGVNYGDIEHIPYDLRLWEIEAKDSGKTLKHYIRKWIRETPIDSL